MIIVTSATCNSSSLEQTSFLVLVWQWKFDGNVKPTEPKTDFFQFAVLWWLYCIEAEPK